MFRIGRARHALDYFLDCGPRCDMGISVVPPGLSPSRLRRPGAKASGYWRSSLREHIVARNLHLTR